MSGHTLQQQLFPPKPDKTITPLDRPAEEETDNPLIETYEPIADRPRRGRPPIIKVDADAPDGV